MPETSKTARRQPAELTEKRIDAILERLAQNKPVRRTLPGGGRLHIDRQLPFLCVYRQPPNQADPGTHRLIVSEASYLSAPGEREHAASVAKLVDALAVLMIERFGAFLVLEVWATDSLEPPPAGSPPRPSFTVHQHPGAEIWSAINALQEGLARIKTSKQSAEVEVKASRKIAPPGLAPLLKASRLEELGAYAVGLEVKPIFVNPSNQELFPLLFRSLKRQLGHVLDQTFYAFAVRHTTHQPAHYHSLGRRVMVKAVWEVDRRLAAVSNSFDLLYQVTPVNAERAWNKFRRNQFEKEPVFLYRPRAIDPAQMKRALYDIPTQRVEDPTLQHLFLDKQMELDRQLTMLFDLGSKQFLYESLQLHGNVSRALHGTAQSILEGVNKGDASNGDEEGLSASAFASRAKEEVAWYAKTNPAFKVAVQVSGDMYSGLLVSRGRLLIGKETRIPAHRADALIQHEIGTHLLTYYNGQAQPFKMLYSGLPGYDELQEGLAVLSEYLVGGLTPARLRVLAARVVGAHALIDGATFVDVFRLLTREHGFAQRTAYTVTMRIYRGGGLVKDAVYLRGLVGILDHLANKGDYDMLFIGKIAAKHIGVIEELLLRKILTSPPSRPRYLESKSAQVRLKKLREGMSVLDLIEG